MRRSSLRGANGNNGSAPVGLAEVEGHTEVSVEAAEHFVYVVVGVVGVAVHEGGADVKRQSYTLAYVEAVDETYAAEEVGVAEGVPALLRVK